jgi:hypothetical protein
MDWYLLNILFIDHPPLAFLLHHSNTPNHHDRYHVQLMALCIVINNVRSFSNMDRIHCVIIHHLIIPTNGSSIIISSTCCRGSSIHRINHPSMPYQHLINHQTSNGTLSLQHIIWSVITIYHLTRPSAPSVHPLIVHCTPLLCHYSMYYRYYWCSSFTPSLQLVVTRLLSLHCCGQSRMPQRARAMFRIKAYYNIGSQWDDQQQSL